MGVVLQWFRPANGDPVDWKYHHVGSYLLIDVNLPNHGQI